MPLRASRLCTWPSTLQFILGALLPLVSITNVRWGCRDPGPPRPCRRESPTRGGRRPPCAAPLHNLRTIPYRIHLLPPPPNHMHRPNEATDKPPPPEVNWAGYPSSCRAAHVLGSAGRAPRPCRAACAIGGDVLRRRMPEAWMYSAAGRGAIHCAAAGMRAAILLLAACMPAQPRPPASRQPDGRAPPAHRAVPVIVAIDHVCL